MAFSFTKRSSTGRCVRVSTVSPPAGVTDNDAPWRVPGGQFKQGEWVRLRGIGLDGAQGPFSAPAQAV